MRDYKVLGQAYPAANTDATLFTVNTGKSTVVSFFTATCQSKTGDPVEVSVALVPAGEVLAAKHYIASGVLVDVRETINIPTGMGLAAGTKVIVRSSSGTVSFTASGVEQDIS